MRGSGGRGAVDGRGFSQVHTSPLIQEVLLGNLLQCRHRVTPPSLQSGEALFLSL